MAIQWHDVEAIVRLLREAHPDKDPLRLRYRDLRRMVPALPGFQDDPQNATDSRLDAIANRWHEEKEGRRE